MAKHTLTPKKLAADSGEANGLFLYSNDGQTVLLFIPLDEKTVKLLTVAQVKSGMTMLQKELIELATKNS